MKINLKRGVIAVLTLAVVLGIGFQVRGITVHAQASGIATTPEAESPAKNQQEKDENDAYLHSPMVARLGHMVGLNTEQAATAFQVGNFVLLAGLVLWGLGKILPKFIRDRNASIQKHLVDARTATEEAKSRLSSVEDRLSKLDGEIAAMRAHAEQDAAKEEQRIKASVEDEKKKILAAAEQEIAAATLHAQKQLQQHAGQQA